MSEIKVPPVGTRVEVETRYTIEWMNQYRRPIVGVVAYGNPWDKPGTMRLVAIENPDNHNNESTITLERITALTILGTSMDPNNPDAANVPNLDTAKVYEIEGSKGDLYTVVLDGEKASCTCQAGSRGRVCRHIKIARERAD